MLFAYAAPRQGCLPLISIQNQWPYAGGGKRRPRPLHPRPGRCPWEPPIDVAKRPAHMPTGRSMRRLCDAGFGITKACAGAIIMRQASFAGGLGAAHPPNGEREGRSYPAPVCKRRPAMLQYGTPDWARFCLARLQPWGFCVGTAGSETHRSRSPPDARTAPTGCILFRRAWTCRVLSAAIWFSTRRKEHERRS
jgi:hypothetical protein